MINRLSRAWRALTTRSFEGAEGGRRWSGFRDMPAPRSSQIAGRALLASRARSLVANNAIAAAGAEAWVGALVGTGIRPQSKHPDPSTRLNLNAGFETWTDEADADGLCDAYALQALMARRMVVDGESFAVLMATPDGLRVRVLDAEQIDPQLHRDLPGGGRIVAGIEFDSFGRRVSYHVLERAGLSLNLPSTAVRVPAEDVVHLFRPEFPGQVRGVSWFAPVLLRLADLDAWSDAQIVRQKIATLMTAFITDATGGASPAPGDPIFAGDQQADTLLAGLQPGYTVKLPPGKDVRFSDPAEIGEEAISFAKVTMREIAAGLGVPAAAITGDYGDANYSSLRASLLDFRARVENIQHHVVAFQLLRPLWRRWAAIEVLSGRVAGEIAPALGCRWITPKLQWVDPKKDSEAEIAAIGAGLMSRREAVSARGHDIETLDAEIAADRAREKSLNLSFGAVAAPTTQGAAHAAVDDA